MYDCFMNPNKSWRHFVEDIPEESLLGYSANSRIPSGISPRIRPEIPPRITSGISSEIAPGKHSVTPYRIFLKD